VRVCVVCVCALLLSYVFVLNPCVRRPLIHQIDRDEGNNAHVELQVGEYGQVPQQLFGSPHPRRLVKTTGGRVSKRNPLFSVGQSVKRMSVQGGRKMKTGFNSFTSAIKNKLKL
jgi:hypothetical protein